MLKSQFHLHSSIIELDDGKFYRKALYCLYLMVKTHGFPADFPLNQSIESSNFRGPVALKPLPPCLHLALVPLYGLPTPRGSIFVTLQHGTASISKRHRCHRLIHIDGEKPTTVDALNMFNFFFLAQKKTCRFYSIVDDVLRLVLPSEKCIFVVSKTRPSFHSCW